MHVLDLETRECSDAEAMHRLAAATAAIDTPDLLGVRIDSTLRGPIAASLNVLLRDPSRAAVIVAAFPASGRTTSNGVHHVHGVPLAETEVAHDPVSPVTSSRPQEWIGGRLCARAAALPLDTVRQGADAIEAALAETITNARAVFCDAETDRDIAAIAQALVALRRRRRDLTPVPVDPGPFTAAVLHALLQPHALAPLVFGIIGSVMDTSCRQMDFVEAGGYAFTVPYRAEPVGALLSAFEQAPRTARALLLRTDTAVLAPGMRQALYGELAALFHRMVARFPTLGGYVLSGGETAGRLLSTFGAHSLRMQGEIQPLVTLSRIADGALRDSFVVTKGGTVGDTAAIADAIGRLYEALADTRDGPHAVSAPAAVRPMRAIAFPHRQGAH